MSDKIVVGPINQGLRTDRTPFVIDNDSFPYLVNAYQWRGRIRRKRGTSFLGRLTRYFNSSSTAYSSTSTITLSGGGVGAGNLLTGFNLQTNGNIVPGSVNIANGGTHYTDPSMDGTLSPSGSINYATGAIVIAAEAGNAVTAIFRYYPDLPVLGLEDLNLDATAFPGTLAFDTTYSYNILTTVPYSIYDVSFYKNPATSGGYTEKTTVTPVTWNGQTYQQFWTTNYQGALWATNGINVPFSVTNVGMQFKAITNVTMIVAGPPATARLTITGHGLLKGDFLFLNEIGGVTGINFQTVYVTNVFDANNVDIEGPNATFGGAYTSGGIAQYLTNRSDTTKDCLRWYDGDPTNANPTTPTLNGHKGWVNFCPPLSQSDFSIGDLPADQYYLVGARIIVPYKDRLLFIGPVVQTSAAGSQKYLQDTIIYSQNGTPYYTASFTGSVDSASTVFNQLLVPDNQTATANAYFNDQAGLGGFISAGFAQPIITAGFNEDVLIIGFSNRQTRLAYTGNDLVPFAFYTINTELGSGSTFSSISLDRGSITIGANGFVITSQTASQRIDLQILDSVFQFNLQNNGAERICAQRDFINEWIYFTYPGNEETSLVYPNQTLQYNYRDESWAVFNESYTTYGTFRKQTGYTWATIGLIYPTWASWTAPWNAGTSTLLQPQVIGGNAQGFVIIRDDGTNESNSLFIKSFSGNTVTSPSHTLNDGDFIIISGCIGGTSSINGEIFQVQTPDADTFVAAGVTISGTYFGGGVIKRMYRPYFQTKAFPTSWGIGRKTRIGSQQYLLSTTDNGQMQLLIFLSQNFDLPYNTGPIVPDGNVDNSSLIYSTILYTCPESTNLGLTAPNTNLQMPTAVQQEQIWHRVNTSLIGDTVQLGFTLSDDQMRDEDFKSQFAEIELHAFIINVSPSQYLA